MQSESQFAVGGEIKWRPRADWVFDATLNPDFSQVEADVAQLDVNTRFALFYPEKRPFFLEGGDLFNTRINALYSRNIADPDWGLKLTGKQGAHSLGLIVAQDAITNLLLRFYDPDQGAIRLGGHDLRHLSLEQIRSMISVHWG